MAVKTLQLNENPVITIAKAILVLAAIPGLLLLITYIVRVVSNPWSWSLLNKSSVTGSWAGTVEIPAEPVQVATDPLGKQILAEQLAREHATLPQPRPAQRIVFRIQPHLQFFTFLTHVAGTAETCDASGKLTKLEFTMGNFNHKRLRLMLENPKNFTDGGGNIEGILNGDAMNVAYRTGDGTFHGTLTRKSASDFRSACSVLSQNQGH
jgi:hypothetical protein